MKQYVIVSIRCLRDYLLRAISSQTCMNTGFCLFANTFPEQLMFNEFYARDTSRKIRSVFKSKGMSGKHLTGTVIYGYLWDEKREHWLVDEEAAEVVHRIFSLTLEGYGPYQIACKLSADRIEIPVVHLARFNEGVNRSKPVKDPYGWGSSTIVNILKKREYLGHTINFKTRKHFKEEKPLCF